MMTTNAPPNRLPADSPAGSKARWLTTAMSSQTMPTAARTPATIVRSRWSKATASSRSFGTSRYTAANAATPKRNRVRKNKPDRRRPAASRPDPGTNDPRAAKPRKRP